MEEISRPEASIVARQIRRRAAAVTIRFRAGAVTICHTRQLKAAAVKIDSGARDRIAR
jgi:hypothetical protein